jgi:GTP cyclohydrolase I
MKKNRAVVKVMQPKQDQESIASLMKSLLLKVGEDPAREGLVRTPERAEKAFRFLTSGYETDIESIVNGALFSREHNDGMVVVKDIEFFSMCEHHLLPFFGKMHVAYLPKDKLIGLSKILDTFARRLQIQERLTQQVAESIEEVLQPRGVGVICEARHFCMMMRGVEKQQSGTVTSAMLGAFRERKETRDEFLSLVAHKNHPFY